MAFLDVLTSQETMETIAAFQPGQYTDLAPFEALPSFFCGTFMEEIPGKGFSKLNITTNATTNDDMISSMKTRRATTQRYIRQGYPEKARPFFDRWYDQYGVSRLGKYFRNIETQPGVIVVDAIVHGRLDVLEVLHQRKDFKSMLVPLIDLAACYGQVPVVKFFVEKGYGGCSTFTMDDAARNGHLEVVKWLHEHSAQGCTFRAVDYAAEFGHEEVIRFLLDNRDEGFSINAVENAAANGFLSLVDYLIEESGDDSSIDGALVAAAGGGQMDIVQFCLEKSEKGCVKKALQKATSIRQVVMIQFLKSRQCACCSWDAPGVSGRKIVKPRTARRQQKPSS
ncbi:hypothetical protein AeMF1_010126 [Aphanomyces euteiches]|nr:hypothetical protein AeMF1_010126 [Aphanomyces euteiches]KAH9197205.1 hypothetical protein AeNC1_000812 [Aphanomyces euteiches]